MPSADSAASGWSRSKWWTLAVVGSGTFMSALDTSIVNVALPVIRDATHAAVSTVEWVVLAYLITVSAALLLFGRLADLYDRRRLYLAGQLVFVLGSLACGLSRHVGALIAARAVQALGASLIFALSPAILVSAFSTCERGRAFGLQATLTYLGLTLGPGVGGLLLGRFGWPAIFFVNVPVGVVVLGVAAKVLRAERPQNGHEAFDSAGAVAFALALGSMLLVLSKGGEWGWGRPAVLGLAATAAVAGALFVAAERRVRHPALDLTLFRNPTFSSAVLAAYLCYLASASVSFLMPFFLLSGCGYSAPRAGAVLMGVPIAMMATTGPSGWLSDRVGVRAPATLGLAVMAVGVGLLGQLQIGESVPCIVGSLACFGVGAGLFTVPNNIAMMSEVPPARRGIAGAVLSAARTVGFASGVAMAGLVYTHALSAAGPLAPAEAVAQAVRRGLRATLCVSAAALVCGWLGRRWPRSNVD